MNIRVAGSAVSPQGNFVPVRKNTDLLSAPTDPVLDTSEMTRKEVRTAINNGAKISIGEEQLIRAIDRALKAMQGPSTELEVSVHEKTHAIMVKVLNKDTGELIREVPPEKTLDIVAKMMEIAGLIIDERV
ncbi:flagellar protein FlaG [Paenibacillus forsythiae]|uniref:Flagellar protein FlaG n=1 Tax=Paenibacillus forsythiae TaxID=365616 RepID=A0ABU3HB00_9BACL|nr:flagellar protein FlaG [Paenibacillus forsythiae]MDT3428008.1 flagellar protein FlaG [Paenibacillus forsythiae]